MEENSIYSWKTAVLGSGTMGSSLAILFASHGHEVNLYNRTFANLEQALEHIKANIQTLVDLNMMSAGEAQQTDKRIHPCVQIGQAVTGTDYIVENVAEDLEIKRQIFRQIEQFAGRDAVVASNTSTMYDIFEKVEFSHPDRVIITHFFNPAYVLPLVELVRGPLTSDGTVERTRKFLEHCQRQVAVVKKAIPGFILNRITLAVFREASYIAGQGWAEPEDIDKALTAIYGPRYAFEGPFGLCDFAGVDIYERLSELLNPVLCDIKETPELVKRLVKEGRLGVKTERGFYTYENQEEANRKRDLRILKMIEAIRRIDVEVNEMTP